MSEFYDRLDNDKDFLPKVSSSDNLLSLDGMREHYKRIYEIHNREVFDFFEHFDRERLFFCHLRDEMKWEKLGDFLGIEVKDELEVHENKSE